MDHYLRARFGFPLFGDWWTDNWLSVVLGIGGIVATILVAWISYIAMKKDKVPRYSVKTNSLIKGLSQEITELDIHYEGHAKPIDNLTVSQVLFWNAGKDTIRASDVVKTEPIRVQMKGDAIILSASMIDQDQMANHFTIQRKRDKKCATIGFDYIDCNEGAIFQIVHTGISGDDVEILGLVKGAGNPKRVLYHMEKAHSWRGRLGPVWLLLGIAISVPVVELEERLGIRQIATVVLFDSFLLLILVILLWRVALRRRKPTTFDKFNDRS